jgi:ABC-type branched-subunit amino acid transport system substrate-binding protein
VSRTTVDVGALVDQSGPDAAADAPAIGGVRAYLAMVDAAGGVDGRRVVLSAVADDGGTAAGDVAAARRLVDTDHVFAVVGVATESFAGASVLASSGTPTFGEVTGPQWRGQPDLFGTQGSVPSPTGAAAALTWAAKQVGATSAAVVSYGGQATTDGPCRAAVSSLERAGVGVPVEDDRFTPGGSPNDDVFRMAADHVDLLVSCLDGTDTLHFEQAMKGFHLADADAIWLHGDDGPTVAANAAAVQRSLFMVPHVPLQAASEYATEYPGIVTYVHAMARTAPEDTYDDAAFEGWVAAAQFVAGLRAAGAHPTRQAVVAAIDRETAFTAGGVMAPVDWRVAHTEAPSPSCWGFSEAYGGQLVPALVHAPGQLLSCFDGAVPTPVTPPAGTPGPVPTGSG